MQKSFITPELRPKLKGTNIKRREDLRNIVNPHTEEGNVSPSIIIIGSMEDGTASYFENFVRQKGYSVEMIYLEDPMLTCKFLHHLQVKSYPRKYPGIYYRGGETDDSKLSETLGVLHDLLTFYPGVVINRPSRLSLNYSKPLQMASIAGANSPLIKAIPTLVTNLNSEINKLPAEEFIIKSMSYIRSEVVDLTDQRLRHKGDSINCPVQLQKKLQGVNIRVHVCSDFVHSVMIQADSVDYRYGEQKSLKVVELPDEIASWCIQATKSEGLELAGIDLMYEEENNVYWCFEINPMPGYSCFEQGLLESGGEPLISSFLLQRLLE